MKRKVLTVAAAAMAAALLAVPASAKGSAEAGGKTAAKPSISVAIFDRGTVPVEKGTYEQNDVTKWINEHAPVQVKFVPVPRWETTQKYNLWLAAGEAPDIFMEYQPEYTQDYVNQGVLTELSSYIDKAGPTIRSKTPPEVAQWGRYNKGEYAVPQIRSPSAIPNWNVWVRQDWMKQLGLSMPQTTEQLYQLAKAFKDKDPDKKGAWGISLIGPGVGNVYLNMFGLQRGSWTLVGGQPEMAEVTEQYRDTMAYMARFYREKLADPEYFTDKGGNQAAQNFVNGKLGIFPANNIRQHLPTLLKNNPQADVVVMPIPESSYGRFGFYQERPVSLLNMVPKTCKNPEAAVKYLDWMFATGWEWVTYGDEGRHWSWKDGMRISNVDDATYKRDLVYRIDYPIMTQNLLTPEDLYKQNAGSEPIVRTAWKVATDGMKVTMEHPFQRLLPTSGLGLALYTEISQTLGNYAEEIWTKVVIGEIAPDEGLRMVRKEWDSIGYQDLKKQITQKAKELGYLK